jgi:hypothetical protein
MRQAIAAGLAAVSGLDGWHVELVGGSRRHMRPEEAASQQEQQREGLGQGPAVDDGGLGAASCRGIGNGSASVSAGSATPASSTLRWRHHDSDFMVTHSAGIWDDGLIERFRDWLIKQRRLVPPEDGAMTLLQVNPAAMRGQCTAGSGAWPFACAQLFCMPAGQLTGCFIWGYNYTSVSFLLGCLLRCDSLPYCRAALLLCCPAEGAHQQPGVQADAGADRWRQGTRQPGVRQVGGQLHPCAGAEW